MEKETRVITKVITKVEQTLEGKQKITRVIEFYSGNKVAIPINKDGSIKWYEDSQLQK